MGGLFSLVAKLFHSNSKRLSVAVTFVILSTALSKVQIPLGGEIVIGFSPLLVCMMVGTVFCNVCDFSEEIMFKTDRWTAPLYILFFVLSGAELDLRVFGELAVVGIGVAYILSRSMGKIAGASAASKLMKCEAKVCKYLGITRSPRLASPWACLSPSPPRWGQRARSSGISFSSPSSFTNCLVQSSPKWP